MKTIDEAINKCRDLAYGELDPFEHYHVEGFKDAEYEQLAEWLEELKKYKSYKPVDKEFYKEGYNKAIDDFASELENHSIYADTGIGNTEKMEFVAPITRIKEVAEQLKAGGVE